MHVVLEVILFKPFRLGAESTIVLDMKSLTSQEAAELALLEEAARTYARASLSKNTRRGYESDFEDFVYWCKRMKLGALPAAPDTVALYLSKMAKELKGSSLKRRVTAIRKIHELSNHPSPTKSERVKSVLRGILRTTGEAQKHAAPTLLIHIQKMLKALPETPRGLRDKALLLLGFAGGFRRSELVSLDVEDLSLSDDGLAIKIRKSKTDQTGKGRLVGISHGKDQNLCPILALEAWLKISLTTSGPIFRKVNKWSQISVQGLTDQSVRLILKESLQRAGIRETGFSGHSLRAGFVTVAAINGASERDIQRTTGHSSLEVLRRYIRDADLFRDNASKKLGL